MSVEGADRSRGIHHQERCTPQPQRSTSTTPHSHFVQTCMAGGSNTTRCHRLATREASEWIEGAGEKKKPLKPSKSRYLASRRYQRAQVADLVDELADRTSGRRRLDLSGNNKDLFPPPSSSTHPQPPHVASPRSWPAWRPKTQTAQATSTATSRRTRTRTRTSKTREPTKHTTHTTDAPLGPNPELNSDTRTSHTQPQNNVNPRSL